MDWKMLGAYLIAIIIVEVIIGGYLKSYLSKKGDNLATKKDIEGITRLTETVQQEFREGFEIFSSDVHFKYDFYFKQYSELYSKLYGIVMQSEYIRYFVEMESGKQHSFEEAPFVQMSETQKTTAKLNLKKGGFDPNSIETQQISTPVSEFNKTYLCECIIDKAEYASQDLLKLAVSYRFIDCYFGNPEEEQLCGGEIAQDEELRLIKEIVQLIVKEYNFLRKELKISYNEKELETGIPILNDNSQK